MDEATGYQEIRVWRALATMLEEFIAKEKRPWKWTFPFEYYELLYKLRGWDGSDGHKRTHQVGRDTNDIVYDRLAPGVPAELQRINATLPTGGRRDKHRQWFTPVRGHPELKEHSPASWHSCVPLLIGAASGAFSSGHTRSRMRPPAAFGRRRMILPIGQLAQEIALRASLRVALILSVVVIAPTQALAERKPQPVLCGEKWVSFVPYARNALNVSGVRFHMRKSDIWQGRIGEFSVGFLHLRPGSGWTSEDSKFRLPGKTYQAVMQCVVGPLPG